MSGILMFSSNPVGNHVFVRFNKGKLHGSTGFISQIMTNFCLEPQSIFIETIMPRRTVGLGYVRLNKLHSIALVIFVANIF